MMLCMLSANGELLGLERGLAEGWCSGDIHSYPVVSDELQSIGANISNRIDCAKTARANQASFSNRL